MTNVSASGVYSGPWKTARGEQTGNVLYESDEFLGPKNQLEEVLKTAREFAENKRITGSIMRNRYYNEAVAQRLHLLKDKRIYFKTGESKDIAGIKTLGFDPYANRNALSDQEQEMWRRLVKKGIDPKEWAALPLVFILTAQQYDAGKDRMVDLFDVVNEVNERPELRKKNKVGETSKSIDDVLPKKGVYQINPWVFDVSLAKKVYGHNLPKDVTEHGIEKGARFYVHMTAKIMARLMNVSDQTEFDVFASQSSPYFTIAEWATKYCKLIYGKDVKISKWSRRLFEGVSMPRWKEAEDVIVGRLETRIYNRAMEGKRREDVRDMLGA